MFGIGFFELLIIAVFGLLIFGPEKLPEAIRSFAHTASRARRAWQATRRELEQELGMDEIRREIHNAEVMENLEKIKRNQTDASRQHLGTDDEHHIAGHTENNTDSLNEPSEKNTESKPGD